MAFVSSAVWKRESTSNAMECSSRATPDRHGNAFSTRGRTFFPFAGRCFITLEFDAVMVLCPLAGSVAYAALHKLFYGKPLWLNVQDLPADAAAASQDCRGQASSETPSGRSTLALQPGRCLELDLADHDRTTRAASRSATARAVPAQLASSVDRGPDPGAPAQARPHSSTTSSPSLCRQYRRANKACSSSARLWRYTTAPFQFQIHGDGGAASEVREWMTSSA